MINKRASAAAIVMSIVGAAGFLIMPVVLGASVVEFQLSVTQVGLLGSMLMAGSFVSAVSALFWARSVDWRVAASVAFVIQGGGLLLLIRADSFPGAALLFLLVSLGGGAVYSLALTVLSDHVQSDRMFGYSITGQVAFQVLGLMLLDRFVAPGGFNQLIYSMLALVGVGIFLSRWLPSHGKTGPAISATAVFRQPRATSALFGCLFFFFNVGCIWAYIERIASKAGFLPEQVGPGLAIAVSVGMAGSLAASWQGTRFGRMTPLTMATFGTAVAVVFMRADVSLVGFMAAVSAYNFFWNYSLVYQYAVVADADETGRCVAVAPAFHALGATIGPAAAAVLLSPNGFLVVNMLAIIGVVVSLGLFVPAARQTIMGSGSISSRH